MDASSFRLTWKAPALAVVIGWAYWPTLGDLCRKWLNDPGYSHGLLVPVFAAYLLFLRKPAKLESQSAPMLGLAALAFGLALRTIGAAISFLALDGYSLVFTLLGIALLAGGRPMLRWVWPSLLFLMFAVPLPYQVERFLGGELQKIATMASTFLLQICGQPAIAQGNLILIDEIKLGVVEQCSGLRMLVTFVAFAVGAVFLMERHWITKALVLAGAVPIAIITNVLRITVTGLFHVHLEGTPKKETTMEFIHDFNGWMMMPVGLMFLMIQLMILKRLLIEKPKTAIA